MRPARHRDTPLRGATYTTHQPYCEARDGAAPRNYKRTALPPPEGMCEKESKNFLDFCEKMMGKREKRG